MALTAVEVAIFYVTPLSYAIIPLLAVLSIGKFGLVVLYYMHLKFDSRIFSGMFFFGMMVAHRRNLLFDGAVQLVPAVNGPCPNVDPASGEARSARIRVRRSVVELDTGSLGWRGRPEPGSVVLLVAIEGAYLLGVGPLRERNNWADDVDPRQVATFTLGILILFLALVSPIDVVSDNYLFSVHMLQHVLLTLVAPPLMVRGLPDWLIRPLLRPNWSFRTARALTHPIGAFLSFNIIFSLWHFPAL